MIRKVFSSHKSSSAELARAEQGLKRLREREDVGFWRCADRTDYFSASQARAREIQAQSAQCVILGIGGSALGAKALHAALRAQKPGSEQLHFIDNPDPFTFERMGRQLKGFKDTHFVAISKTGSTLETLSLLEAVLDSGVAANPRNFTVISERSSNPLARWAAQHSIPHLEFPVDVGGRFSVFTPVGLLPAAIMGFDLEAFRKGMQWSLAQSDLVLDLCVETLQSWSRQEWITVFWFYSDQLAEMGLWIQQLWAESLGKKTSRQKAAAPRVSTPLPLVGAVDQHSILQQLMDGARDKWIWILDYEAAERSGHKLARERLDHGFPLRGLPMGSILNAEAEATTQALAQNGISTLKMSLEQVNESSLGAFMMSLALTVGVLGEILDIDAYDQPGVELGKKLVRDILAKRVVSPT